MRTSDTIFWLSAKESTSRAGGGQLLWITLWTVWIICGHTRFIKAKSAKNTVDNPVETVDAFAQFETI
jgi:hypothetical protein